MKHPIRRRFMFLGFQGLRALTHRLPLGALRGVGRTLGRVAYGLLPRQRRLAMDHLGLAFGEGLTRTQRKRIVRGVFLNLGQTAMEWMRLATLSTDELQQLVTCEGLEVLRGVLAEGNGAILVTAHFGNWEVILHSLTSLGFTGAVLARRLRYPEYESFLMSSRGAKGVATLTRGSLKEVARSLRANQVVGMLPDQDVDSLEGIFVDFFGRPAYTPVGPAALSRMTGAPIVPCFTIRDGRRFRLVVEPPLRAPEGMDRAQALRHLTQAWSDVVESYIRRYPDQWVWMHRRWKTQPSPAPVAGETQLTPPLAGRPERARCRTGEMDALTSAPAGGGWGGLWRGRRVAPRAATGSERSEDERACATRATGRHRGAARASGRAQAAPGSAAGGMEPRAIVSVWLCAVCCLLGGVVTGCAKSGAKPEAVAPAPEPDTDQTMSEFTLTGYNQDGATRWTMSGKGATLDGEIVTILHPEAVGFEPGRTAYLTASAAQMHQQTRHVRMEHDVTIHTSDGIWFTSPVLHWIPDQDQIATDQPVRMETDHMLLRGRGASGLTQLKHAKVFEDIEVVLNPGDHDVAAEGPQQVIITCEGPLTFDYEHHVATFEKNVHVKDPSGDLYSDTLIAYLDEATHAIRYADAVGHVRIHQNQNTALSERAVYEPTIGKITLVGRPSLLLYPDSKTPQSTRLSFGGLVGAPASPSPSPQAAGKD